MKVECGQSSDGTRFICPGEGGVDCAENAEGNEEGMSEIIVQLDDELPPSSPETFSSPETDIFLFAPVSDFEEDGANCDSDSSSVPAGNVKQQSSINLNVRKIKLEGCAEKNGVVPRRTDRKPRRKKTSSPVPKHNSSLSTNGQPKRRGTKKSLVKIQPCKSGQAEQDRMSGETAGWIPAPYTKQETAISPQAAMEPPGFPSLQGKMEEPFCEKKDNILLEVLKYCQTLCTVVQRLEQKIDSLQADCSQLYLHINREDSKKEWHSAIQRPVFKGADLQFHAPTLSLRPPDKPHASSFLGRDEPPWGCVQQNKVNAQCLLPSNGNTFTCGPNSLDSSQPEAYFGEADKASAGKIAGRGRRGRGQGRGRRQGASRKKDPALQKVPPLRANQPKRRVSLPVSADEGLCASKVAKILSELQGRRSAPGGSVEECCEATKNNSVSNDKEQHVMIGSAFRKVWIPYSVYMEAFKQDEPQKAVVPVLHAVFSQSVLCCSAVVPNPQRGIQELSPNKLEAIREWLAEMYPRHELEVKGKAWAECLGVLNSITKKLKTDTTPTKTASFELP
ncbi:hypothetical protein AALO_G00126230 [Alosa alosa]|uniref:BEN domain-containing protein n=2 Tax=Alosa alosa TaxID=278164 RepID=A0AAV6GLG3_9TELE|nr:uncharacterized protein si:zfos-905g2.1 isoform X1 [Alosa alosa]KAG5275944.1 hypothetical protein AALO_G00126230 [Alosa alosa]